MSSNDELAARPARTNWRFAAVLAATLFVVLCALFAAPLIVDFPYFAPEGGAPTVAEGLAITPTEGPTEQRVVLEAAGLTPVSEVTIEGGLDRGRMQVLGRTRTDSNGDLRAETEVPDWAERGKPFYFAVAQDGARVGVASINVIVLDDVAPASVGGGAPAGQ
jgi:hypothetical protein